MLQLLHLPHTESRAPPEAPVLYFIFTQNKEKDKFTILNMS